MEIVKAKIQQATRLLDELNIDAWALFERETAMQKDSTHELVVGLNIVWNSLFLYTRHGDAIALVGNFDADDFTRSGRFTRVESVKKLLCELDPKSLALNYSTDDPASDGLTHGMFLQFSQYLVGTPYASRFVSSQTLISKLKYRKLPEEIARLEHIAGSARREQHLHSGA